MFSLGMTLLQENAEQQQDRLEMHQLEEKQCKAITWQFCNSSINYHLFFWISW